MSSARATPCSSTICAPSLTTRSCKAAKFAGTARSCPASETPRCLAAFSRPGRAVRQRSARCGANNCVATSVRFSALARDRRHDLRHGLHAASGTLRQRRLQPVDQSLPPSPGPLACRGPAPGRTAHPRCCRSAGGSPPPGASAPATGICNRRTSSSIWNRRAPAAAASQAETQQRDLRRPVAPLLPEPPQPARQSQDLRPCRNGRSVSIAGSHSTTVRNAAIKPDGREDRHLMQAGKRRQQQA